MLISIHPTSVLHFNLFFADNCNMKTRRQGDKTMRSLPPPQAFPRLRSPSDCERLGTRQMRSQRRTASPANFFYFLSFLFSLLLSSFICLFVLSRFWRARHELFVVLMKQKCLKRSMRETIFFVIKSYKVMKECLVCSFLIQRKNL